jgi:hypothetical protein
MSRGSMIANATSSGGGVSGGFDLAKALSKTARPCGRFVLFFYGDEGLATTRFDLGLRVRPVFIYLLDLVGFEQSTSQEELQVDKSPDH